MCIIIYSPDGFIPKKQLRRSLNENPHGWGVMVASEGKVKIAKGLTNKSFWNHWRTKPEGPVVFHARIMSHGEIDLANCHPFPVPNHGQLHVAHNGIIKHHAFKNSPVSDTRLFIRDILAGLPRNFLANASTRRLIEQYVGWSKLVFLDEKGNATILNEEMGHWNNDRWYSNNSYKPIKKEEPKLAGGLDRSLFVDLTADGDEKAGEVVDGFFATPSPSGKNNPPENVPLYDWRKRLYNFHVT